MVYLHEFLVNVAKQEQAIRAWRRRTLASLAPLLLAFGVIALGVGLLIENPWIAFVVAGGFAVLWLYNGARSAWITAVLCILYGVYEYLIYVRVLCSGECNIRIDLLLIYPALLIAMIVSVWQSFVGRLGRVRPGR